jgi:hypothetical protein
LDEKACADVSGPLDSSTLTLILVQLAYRLGGMLWQLGSLHVEYSVDVLTRAQRGGYIRWHMVNVEDKVISSTVPMSCIDTYYVWVCLEVRSLSQIRPATDVVYRRDLVKTP